MLSLPQKTLLKIKKILNRQQKDVKERMATKEDFNDLQPSVDAYAKKADAYFQEMVMLTHKVDRHEKWFHLIAEKLGMKLEYWVSFNYFLNLDFQIGNSIKISNFKFQIK